MPSIFDSFYKFGVMHDKLSNAMVSPEAFVHPQSLIDAGVSIGARTRVWAFAHLVSGAQVGDDCNICDHTFIEGGVQLGNRVTVKCGVFLWNGLIVEDDVFIGPSVSFTNDLLPRSRKQPKSFAQTRLMEGCSLGANCTVLPVTVGRWAVVGSGSVVTRDVPNHALVFGVPARIRGWVCYCGQKLSFGKEKQASCICGRSFEQEDEQSVKEIKK